MRGVAYAPKGTPRKIEKVEPQGVATPPRDDRKPSKSSSVKATASKTNRGAVERMGQLAANRPDLAEKVKTGATTVAQPPTPIGEAVFFEHAFFRLIAELVQKNNFGKQNRLDINILSKTD